MRLTPEQLALRVAEREAYELKAIKEYVKRVVAEAPPPTESQRIRIMTLLSLSRTDQTPEEYLRAREERRREAERNAEESWAKSVERFRARQT